jgi:glycosyltransferase involved in cell wall biosynthesis
MNESRERSRPLVSIITPTWRRAPEIVKRCLDCVRIQTYCTWEQIVCSDGKREAAIAKLAEARRDPRVRYRALGEHRGDYANTVRATMLNEVAGEYVVFLDDDNIILPNYLERMVTALQEARNGEQFAICRILHFGPFHADLGDPPQLLTGIPPRVAFIDTLQVMMTAEAIRAVGWNTSEGYIADGHTFEALARRFRWVEMPECLALHM